MKTYIPLCPLGRMNCIHDPAYVQHYFPKWYDKNLLNSKVNCLKDLCPYDLFFELEEKHGLLEND